MANDFDTYWDELVGRLARRKGLISTSEELEKELANLKSEPLSDNEINSIVTAVNSGESNRSQIVPDLSWIDDFDTSSIEEGVLQLNRNKGDSDADVEERIEELRKRELEEGSHGEEDVETD